jgi:hypothetical protein
LEEIQTSKVCYTHEDESPGAPPLIQVMVQNSIWFATGLVNVNVILDRNRPLLVPSLLHLSQHPLLQLSQHFLLHLSQHDGFRNLARAGLMPTIGDVPRISLQLLALNFVAQPPN